jgi:hypothetical protein
MTIFFCNAHTFQLFLEVIKIAIFLQEAYEFQNVFISN